MKLSPLLLAAAATAQAERPLLEDPELYVNIKLFCQFSSYFWQKIKWTKIKRHEGLDERYSKAELKYHAAKEGFLKFKIKHVEISGNFYKTCQGCRCEYVQGKGCGHHRRQGRSTAEFKKL